MFAIISDIHSNLEALTTVLDDIEKRGIKTVYCLGDVVGYAANPLECLDLIIDKTEICVQGNHDFAAIFEPTNFNSGAEAAAYWTRKMLEEEPNQEKRDRRWQFLGSQKMRWTRELNASGGKTILDLVHASPRRPINEYIFPDDVYTTTGKMTGLFGQVKHICFIGHTHLPGVFLEDPDFYSPGDLDDIYPIIPDEKAIINVGSVGQPRARDNRASYVYIEDNNVHFVRLNYDFKAAAAKIYETPELDNFEGDRLADGR